MPRKIHFFWPPQSYRLIQKAVRLFLLLQKVEPALPRREMGAVSLHRGCERRGGLEIPVLRDGHTNTRTFIFPPLVSLLSEG